MPIDHELRAKGIGGSDIAKIAGLSKFGDQFSVFVDKLGLLKRDPPSAVQRRGKRWERLVVEWYAEETQSHTAWFDRTVHNVARPWQLVSPDAPVITGTPCPRCAEINENCEICHGVMFVWDRTVDAKTVGFGGRDGWGEQGSDIVPDDVSLQAHWCMSTLGLQRADVAAAFSMDELRIYRFYRDSDIERILLETAAAFQANVERAREHALNGGDPMDFAPPIGSSPAAAAYLKQRFPRNTEALRIATPEEAELMAKLKLAGEEYDAVNARWEALANQIKESIGASDGIQHGPWKITWKRSRDSMGIEFSDVAQELGLRCELLKAQIKQLESRVFKLSPIQGVNLARPEWFDQTYEDLAKQHEMVLREGSRKLLPNWGKKTS